MSKKSYIRPVFVKQVAGVMNKFGVSNYKSYRDSIRGVAINNLVEQFGSPLFIIDQKMILQRHREIKTAFTTRYPNVKLAWSYKTNYLDAVCATMHHEGMFAEVVSDFEFEKAKRLNVPGNSIIINGPYKSLSLLKRAFNDGVIVNVDNFDELMTIDSLAKEMNRQLEIGIRVSFEPGIYPSWNKFGFSYEAGQAREAVNRIARGNLKLKGIHTHIGTFVLDTSMYSFAAEKMVQFLHEAQQITKSEIDYIDMGGGFPSRNRLKGIYLSPDVAVPAIDEYAEAICNALLKNLHPNQFPLLFIESGRAIIDDAGYLVTTVHARKQLADGTKCLIVDAGVNLLPTSAWYNHSVQPDKQLSGVPEPYRIYGPLCMNIDVLADSVYLPSMSPGDHLVISPVGAYNLTQWMQFITYRPAVVMIMEDQTVECIRKAETLEEMVKCEYLPESLNR